MRSADLGISPALNLAAASGGEGAAVSDYDPFAAARAVIGPIALPLENVSSAPAPVSPTRQPHAFRVPSKPSQSPRPPAYSDPHPESPPDFQSPQSSSSSAEGNGNISTGIKSSVQHSPSASAPKRGSLVKVVGANRHSNGRESSGGHSHTAGQSTGGFTGSNGDPFGNIAISACNANIASGPFPQGDRTQEQRAPYDLFGEFPSNGIGAPPREMNGLQTFSATSPVTNVPNISQSMPSWNGNHGPTNGVHPQIATAPTAPSSTNARQHFNAMGATAGNSMTPHTASNDPFDFLS